MSQGDEPSWRPDPSRRHELRWYDGTSFTDRVADAGVQSIDAGPPAPLPVWAVPGSVVAAAPPPSLPAPRARRRRSLGLALAVVGVLAVAGGSAYLLLGGDDGAAGEGTFTGFAGGLGDQLVGQHEIRIPAGSVAIVTVEPSDLLDAVVGFAVDADVADRVDDIYDGGPFEAQGNGDGVAAALFLEDTGSPVGLDADAVVFALDLEFEGGEEQTFLALPFAADATVVVAGFATGGQRSAGSYDITIDIVPIELGDPDDLTGDDVLDAVVAADEVPESVKEIITTTAE